MSSFTITLPSGASWTPTFVQSINEEKCIGCGRCFRVCPRGVLELVGLNDEGERMCRAMGDKDILFLRNHGVIVSGPTVAQAYDDLYYLERAAMVQVLAMQTGRELHNIDEAMAEHTARQIAGEAQQAFLHFESLKRMLDRDEAGWSRLTAVEGR